MSYVVLREKPLPGESIHSLLIRLAELNDYTFYSFYRYLGTMSSAYRYDSLYFDLQFLHHVTGLNLKILAYCSCEKWIPLSGIEGMELLPFSKAQYCPECLNVKHPYHELVWMVSRVTTCTKHQRTLERSCPGCTRSLSIKDIVEAKCHLCGHSLMGNIQDGEAITKEGLQDQLILQALLTGDIKIPWKLRKYFNKEAYSRIILMFQSVMRADLVETDLPRTISTLKDLPHEFLFFLKTAFENNFLDRNLCSHLYRIWFGRRTFLGEDSIAVVTGLSRYFVDYVLGIGLFCNGDIFICTKQSFISTFKNWHRQISAKEIARVLEIPVPNAKTLAAACLMVAEDLRSVNPRLVESRHINWQLIFFVLQFFSLNFVNRYLLDENSVRIIFPPSFTLPSQSGDYHRLHLIIGLLNQDLVESMKGTKDVKIEAVFEHLVSYIRNRHRKYYEKQDKDLAKVVAIFNGRELNE